MAYVSVTRLRLRKKRYLFPFIVFAFRTMQQSKRTPGNLHASAIPDKRLTFWTITLWNSESDMRNFRNVGAHLKVMPKLAVWCDEATYVHWNQPEPQPPSRTEAHRRLVSEGTVSRVQFPSADHYTRHFPAPG